MGGVRRQAGASNGWRAHRRVPKPEHLESTPHCRNDSPVPCLNISAGAVSPTATRLRSGAVSPNQPILGHDCLPLRQRGGASLLIDLSADEVALLTEMVVDRCVNRGE